MICMLQNLFFFSCCGVARHARVGQKMSDVNDAELPHLEGTSRLIIANVTCVVKICRTANLFFYGASTKRWPPLAPRVFASSSSCHFTLLDLVCPGVKRRYLEGGDRDA